MPRKSKKVIEESSEEENEDQEFEEQSAPEEENEEMEEEEEVEEEDDDSEDEPIVKKPTKGRKSKSSKKEEEANEDDFEDEVPVKAKRKRSSSASKATSSKRSKKSSDFEEDEDDEEEIPIKKQTRGRKSAKKQIIEDEEENDEVDDDSSSDDDEDKIIIKKSTPKKKSTAKTTKSKASTTAKKTRAPRKSKKSEDNNEEEEDDDNKPVKRRRKSKKSENENESDDDSNKHIKRKKLTIAQQLDMAMQSFKWWESPDHPDDIQWFTLEHNGVMFPPAYTRHNIPIKYNNEIVKLNENEEEAATFYCQVALDGPQLGNPKTAPVFKKNFLRDFRAVLTPEHKKLITDFNKLNFDDIRKYLDNEREIKKNRTKDEKEQLKLERQGLQRQYGYAFVDGHLEKVGNFIIEPPGLFRGRGEHPKMGTIKLRVLPEQITLNCGKSEKIPKCPVPGHHWGNIVFKPDCTWLATWTENVMGSVKYVFLAPSSSFKGKSDLEKYEKARRLKNCIGTIRKDYKTNLLSSDVQQRQLATAMWVIDRLALRVGNEKSEDEADTVGCCSLRVEHMKFEEPFLLTLDFIGKDSMRYRNTIDLSKYDKIGRQVFKNLKRFCDNKKHNEDVFDKLSVDYLNKHLQQLMPGLTAKVFRTFNASITLEAQLPHTIDIDTETAEKVRIYNTANREVAILCNHQRTEPKGHEKAMTGLNENLEICKKQLSDLQKWLKDVKKGKDIPLKPDNLEDLDKKEKMKYSHMYNRQPNEAQIENRISTLLVKINTLESNIKNREENKTIALGTSKLNYMDPRITVAWCKRNEVPIEKLFATTLRAKFPWAMSVKSDWTF